MFQDLVDLFSGWYSDYVEVIRDLLQTTHTVLTIDSLGNQVIDTYDVNPEIWSAYVPWEELIATVTLIVFTVCIFKFMRSVLCKIL